MQISRIREKIIIFAFGFRYGAQLVASGEINGGEMIIVFFSILSGGFQVGAFQMNFQHITTAQGAAHFVYNVCDKVLIICYKLY